MTAPPKIRLYVRQPLGQGQAVALDPAHAHYLGTVMRRRVGDAVALFNGADGEWRAEIAEIAKKRGVLTCTEPLRPHTTLPDLWLLAAPIKKARFDMMIEKAAEMGVARIQPVLTAFTDTPRVRVDRLETIATEATEQSRGLSVPEIAPPVKLDVLLKAWPAGRRLFFADEAGGDPAATVFARDGAGPAAILIGPEGGFSEAERSLVTQLEDSTAIDLGGRILRAETAAIVGLGLWHAMQHEGGAP